MDFAINAHSPKDWIFKNVTVKKGNFYSHTSANETRFDTVYSMKFLLNIAWFQSVLVALRLDKKQTLRNIQE